MTKVESFDKEITISEIKKEVSSFDGICTNNYLLVKVIEQKEEMAGGLYRPQTALDKPQWGWVLSVGEGLTDMTGVPYPPDFVHGDLIYFYRHAPEKADFTDRGLGVLHFISEGDVFLKVKTCMTEGTRKVTQIIPLGNFINIEPLEDSVKKESAGGIILPEQSYQRPNKGRVLSVGPGLRTMVGMNCPRIRCGDIVRYRGEYGHVINFEDIGVKKETTIIPYGDILAVEVEGMEELLKARLKEVGE